MKCFMNRKKWRKLRNNPKDFFYDSKFNLYKKFLIWRGVMSLNKLKENNQLEQSKKMILNPIFSFDFDYLIEKAKKYEIDAVYIKPINKSLKCALCILNNKKQEFLNKFLSFLYEEGIDIAYKVDNKIKKPNTINEIYNDFLNVKNIDIRLTTSRNIGSEPQKLWFRLEFCVNEKDYILFPTANYISRKLWKHSLHNSELFNKGLHNYNNIINYSHESEINFDIDLVFTWVNSDDKDWQELYKQFKPDFNSDATSTSRFLSRDELKYALRSWDKYGSFIRKIFIVSNCAPPDWLDLNNTKIEWVYHETIMPESALPTFSSHAIETSLHKIPGISNYFIYSNDDFLLVKPLTGYDFYYSNGIAKLRLENWGNVNGDVCQGEPDYLNAARNSNQLLEKEFHKSTTQLHTHSPQSMRVDVLNEMNQKYQEYFDRTMHNKFRSIDDIAVTGYFYHHYALLSGRALQSSDKTELIQQQHDFHKKLDSIIELHRAQKFNDLPLSVCINDGADSHLNVEWNKAVTSFLDDLFPESSQFEKM